MLKESFLRCSREGCAGTSRWMRTHAAVIAVRRYRAPFRLARFGLGGLARAWAAFRAE
jgi:hypothetical protein